MAARQKGKFVKMERRSKKETAGNAKEHIIWLDLLRVIAIFCMMVLHVCASQFDSLNVYSYEWQVLNIYDSMARFCVPIFVMVSGVFFLNPKREYTLQKLLKNNIRRMVTAYIFWAFCYAVGVSFVECRAFNSSFWKCVVRETLAGRYHLWFVNMIVGIYLVVPFLRKIAEDKKLLEYYILLSFLLESLSSLVAAVPVAAETVGVTISKMSLSMVLGYTGYFMAGYYFYTYEISKRFRNGIYALGILSVLVTIVGTSWLSLRMGSANQVLYNYFFVTTWLSATAVFLFFKNTVSRINFSEKYRAVIAKIAELSFGMYLVHDFVNIALKLIKVTPTIFQPLFAVPLLAVIVFVVSFVIIWIMSNIPFAKKYLI